MIILPGLMTSQLLKATFRSEMMVTECAYTISKWSSGNGFDRKPTRSREPAAFAPPALVEERDRLFERSIPRIAAPGCDPK